MSRRLNVFSNIASFLLTFASLFVVTMFCNKKYLGQQDVFLIIAMFLGFAIVCGFICTLFHELGHLIFGLFNKFAFLSFSVWFLRWWKPDGRMRFDFVLMKEEAGSTEFVPKTIDNIEKRLKSMTAGGLIFSFVVMFFSVPAFIVELPLWCYCFLSMFLPIGSYVFFGNALPMVNQGAYNDGAVILGVNKKHDSIKVMLGLLKIHCELYQGKTPGEINPSYYFDLPQLAEDDLNYISLLNARCNYYLDIGDYENANKVTARLNGLTDYMSPSVYLAVKADELYNKCTFSKDEVKADDLMTELEKYLNSSNTATNLRVKLAYILLAESRSELTDDFYKRAILEAERVQIKGLGLYEAKLLKQLYDKD